MCGQCTEVRCQIFILSFCTTHCPLSLILVPKALIDTSPSMGTPIPVMQVSKRKMKTKFKVQPLSFGGRMEAFGRYSYFREFCIIQQ